MQMRVKYLFDNIPELISSPDNSGYDIRAAIDEPLRIPAYGKACVPTGIAVELSGVPSYANIASAELQVRPRSGHTRQGIVAQFGTIDISYRGEISVNIFNHNACEVEIQPLERIAQLVVVRFSNLQSSKLTASRPPHAVIKALAQAERTKQNVFIFQKI